MSTPASGLELLTVGRISVDLYCDRAGAGWYDAPGFVKAVGGSPTNVAVAAARLGHRCAVFTKVGDDPFGEFLLRRLGELGVDTRYVGTYAGAFTPLAFAVLDPPDEPQLLMYRDDRAPDLHLETGDVPEDLARSVGILWVTGTGMSVEPGASTTLELVRRRDKRGTTIVDLDYRPSLWSSETQARRQIASLLPYATHAVGNRSECEVAVGSDDPDEAASRLLEAGVEAAIVKMGSAGVLVATRGNRCIVPPIDVDVVCALGAGDAFGGALVHGVLSEWDLVDSVRFANAAGALVASRLLCADAMGTAAEIDALLAGAAVGEVAGAH